MAKVDRRWLQDGADLVARHLPDVEMESVTPISEGLDNAAYVVNGELIVRLSKTEDIAERSERVRREAALLNVVAPYSTLPVPEVVFVDTEAGAIAYRMLPGVPLNRIDLQDSVSIASDLGTFLGALHRVLITDVEGLVDADTYPLADWLHDAERHFVEVEETLPASSRPQIEAFLSDSPPPDSTRLVFCHNDLGSEHVLVDASTGCITGIIDWSDAAITDPARDLGIILRDLGPPALDAAAASYGLTFEDDDRERAVFHARCKLLEDIAFGLETGASRYLENGLAHLTWLFP